MELSAAYKNMRALQADTAQLQKENNRLLQEVNIYRLSTNNDRNDLRILQSSNAILQRRDNRQFNLSFGVGYGIAANKETFGPATWIGISAGWTLIRF